MKSITSGISAIPKKVGITGQPVLDRATDFIARRLGERGVPSSRLALDPSFRESFTGAEARERVRLELGAEIGFDLGDEAFSTMLALTLLPTLINSPEREMKNFLVQLISKHRQGWRFYFFFDANGFPADTDCTAVAAGALHDQGVISSSELVMVARELMRATAPEDSPHPNVVMVYWEDDTEPGIVSRGRKYDAVVCANCLYVLKLAQSHGLADAHGVVDATLDYVVDHLVLDRFLEGTRYYPAPEAFLWAASRLCARFADYRATLAGPLREALLNLEARTEPGQREERIRALNLAQRIITADNIGWTPNQHRRRTMLAEQQREDGAWPPAPFYRLGRYPVYFGSASLTTLFAITALRSGA